MLARADSASASLNFLASDFGEALAAHLAAIERLCADNSLQRDRLVVSLQGEIIDLRRDRHELRRQLCQSRDETFAEQSPKASTSSVRKSRAAKRSRTLPGAPTGLQNLLGKIEAVNTPASTRLNTLPTLLHSQASSLQHGQSCCSSSGHCQSGAKQRAAPVTQVDDGRGHPSPPNRSPHLVGSPATCGADSPTETSTAPKETLPSDFLVAAADNHDDPSKKRWSRDHNASGDAGGGPDAMHHPDVKIEQKDSQSNDNESLTSRDSQVTAKDEGDSSENFEHGHGLQRATSESYPSFELFAFWKHANLDNDAPRHHSHFSMSAGFCFKDAIEMGHFAGSGDSFQVSDSEDSTRGIMRRFMLNPTTPYCLLWDMFSAVLIFYDFVTLPLQIFELLNSKENSIYYGIDWVQRLYWTIAIPRSFVVGYMLKTGEIEMRPAKVCHNYICGWMAFDVIVVCADWVEVILDGMEFVGAVRIAKGFRFSRLVRMVRLLRMFKMPTIVAEIDARFFSEKTILVLSIFKIFCLFTCLSHLIACTWYGIGKFMEYDGRSWLNAFDMMEETPAYRYATSLHWALCNFVGSMEIAPTNSYERQFSSIALICSFILSAAFVGRLTASMTRLQIVAGGHESQFTLLRQYLRQHKVSTSLTTRVIRGAQHALANARKNVPEQDIELLTVISEPLQAEIHYQIFFPVCAHHPFFWRYNFISPVAMQKLCHTAASVELLHTDDSLFSAGEVPRIARMFFVMTGTLSYFYEVEVTRLTFGMWACEAALFMPWLHVGDLSANDDCMVMALDAEIFQKTVAKFQVEAYFASLYAASFLEHINSSWTAVRDVNQDFDAETHANAAFEKAQALAECNRSLIPSSRSIRLSKVLPIAELETLKSAQIQGS